MIFPLWIGTRGFASIDARPQDGASDAGGVYASTFDARTGRIAPPRRVAKLREADFFATDDERRLLYVVGRRDASETESSLYVYRCDAATGELDLLSATPTRGRVACHVALDPTRRFVAVSNYLSGDFVVFRLNDDGTPRGEPTARLQVQGSGPNVRRQDGPKAHAAYFDRRGATTRLLTVDLGSDKVRIAILNEATGALSSDPNVPELRLAPGSGPRHLVWLDVDDGAAAIVFVLCELTATLAAFRLDFGADVARTLRGATALGVWDAAPRRRAETPNEAAEIALLRDDRRAILYLSTRGGDLLSIVDVSSFADVGRSTPEPVFLDALDSGGVGPRFFAFDPTRRFAVVCNTQSGTTSTFERTQDGRLRATNDRPVRLELPFVLAFSPFGRES